MSRKEQFTSEEQQKREILKRLLETNAMFFFFLNYMRDGVQRSVGV